MADVDEWTDKKNQRRCDLINRDIDKGDLTPDEKAELACLQAEVQAYVNRVAPLPLEHVRQLYEKLRAEFPNEIPPLGD